MKVESKNDGIDHINIYSKAKTELGRLLSNFSYSPVDLGEDGKFDSIEGYWYWLLCNHQHKDKLRTAWGAEAKELGRFLNAQDWPTDKSEWFELKIKRALLKKAESNARIQKLLIETNLPFYHYYVHKNKVSKVSGATDWFVLAWMKIREYYQELHKIEQEEKKKS